MLLGLKPKDEWTFLTRLSQHDPHYRWCDKQGRPFPDYIELGSNKMDLFLAAAMMCSTWHKGLPRENYSFPAAQLRLITNKIHPIHGLVGCRFELTLKSNALMNLAPGTAKIVRDLLPPDCPPVTGFLRVLHWYWSRGKLEFERQPWRANRDELIGCVFEANKKAMQKMRKIHPIQEGIPL